MAGAQAQFAADDTPLIEEQVDTGLKDLLEGYRSGHDPEGEKPDDLHKRFSLFPTQRLEQYDHAYAKGYAASDEFHPERPIYAMVCDNSLPYRHQAIQGLLGNNFANLQTVLGAGTVYCSHLREGRFVIFLERPAGSPLQQVIEAQTRLHEHKLIDHVLQPVVKALTAMRERKVSHGNIHPGTIYVGGDQSMLGDCYSAPAGTLGHHLYLPMELMMCDRLGVGEGSEKGDVYALGIVAYELLYGLERMKALPKDEYIRLALQHTTYQLFANNRQFSDAMQDFFRGVLNDNPAERWGLDQVTQWLGGKRFNMNVPAAPKDGVRPFAFASENFFSRKLLASAFHRHWREAVKDIKQLKLERWCENSLHKPEMGEKVERALRIAGQASTDRHVSDMMSRIIAILDPSGPIRSMSVSLRPDGIGTMLADSMQQGNQTEMNQIIGMIDTDVSSYWAEQSEANKAGEMGQSLWLLQRARPFLKKKSFGFGLERVLYDLNPSLPCQSDLLRQYHVTTAADALKALDAMAQHLAPETSFMDRHLAAFIASKIDIGKEVRLDDLISIPKLMHNEELVVLKLLAKAQQKAERKEKLQLVGLCTWAAMRVERMIDEIHNRVFRKRLKMQLRKLAATGNLDEVLGAIVNRQVATRDYEGFTQAVALHEINDKKIARFENPALLKHLANEAGGKMATTVSYVILVVTSYIVLSNAVGF